MPTFTMGLGDIQPKKKKPKSVRPYLETEIQMLLGYNVEAKERTTWRASSAGVCERKNVLSLIRPYDSDKSYASAVTMSIGTAIHDVFQKDMLPSTHMSVAEDVMEWKELRLSGHSDGLNIDPMLRIPYIVDFKTCGNVPSKPKYEHVRQLHLYAMLTGFRHASCLELVYIPRNFPHKPKTFSVYDDAILRDVIRTILLSNNHYEQGTIPNRPFVNKTNCTYCQYSSECWQEINDKTTNMDMPDESEFDWVYDQMDERKYRTLKRMLYTGNNTPEALDIINEQLEQLAPSNVN